MKSEMNKLDATLKEQKKELGTALKEKKTAEQEQKKLSLTYRAAILGALIMGGASVVKTLMEIFLV